MEQQISDMGVSSTFTAISKDDMKKIRIPAAPLLIQIRFSNFVEHIDKSKVIYQQLPNPDLVFDEQINIDADPDTMMQIKNKVRKLKNDDL